MENEPFSGVLNSGNSVLFLLHRLENCEPFFNWNVLVALHNELAHLSYLIRLTTKSQSNYSFMEFFFQSILGWFLSTICDAC